MNKRSRRQHLVERLYQGAGAQPPPTEVHAPSASATDHSSFELLDAVLAAAGELITTQRQASVRHHLPEDADVFARYARRLRGIRTSLRQEKRIALAPAERSLVRQTPHRAATTPDSLFAEHDWALITPSELWLFERDTPHRAPHPRRPVLRRVEIPAFRIARHPVTNAHYQLFLQATGYPAPPHWEHEHYPAAQSVRPVTNVSGADAEAFCTWLADSWHCPVHLPNELEWQQAAFSRQMLASCPSAGAPVPSEPDEVCGAIDGLWEWVQVTWHKITCSGYGWRSLTAPAVHGGWVARADQRHRCVGFRPAVLWY